MALLVGGGPAAAAPGFQTRPNGVRVAVDPGQVRWMDGDTAEIHWSRSDVETVRVLGIDTAELFGRRQYGPPRGALDPRGAEGRGFARGTFAIARRVELQRAAGLDRYGRSLGYFYLEGRNYSVLVLEAGLARETISRFGDNGFPREAAEVMNAARHRPAARARPRPN